MKKYTNYKKTNIDWIGEIPFGWSCKKLKYIFTEKKAVQNSKLNCGSISFGEIIYKNNDKVCKETKDSYQEVLKGEFLINPLNLNYDLKSLRIGRSSMDVVVSPGYLVLKINKEFHPDYYKYLLRKFDIEKMKSLGHGVRQTISFRHIKEEKLVYPSLQEQKYISKYLDKNSKIIDLLIEKIEKKIKLLNEQKISLINQYVTKGIERHIEMRDSQIEFMGKIPKHWQVQKIKALYSESSRRGHEDEDNLSVFRDYGVVRRDDHENKNVLPQDLSNYKLVQKGDLVLNKMKTWMGSLGISNYQGIVSPAYYVLTPNFNFFAGYFHHLLRSKLYIAKYASLSKGVRPGQWDLSIRDFKSLKIILPPIEEQKQINEFIIKKLSDISRLSELEVRRIEKLIEFRHSLISSVVSGKILITEDMI